MTDVTRRAPPTSQTLTFLFSDLRDYTRFVEQFGDAAATTLIGDYRRIVRGEVGKAAGAEITQGWPVRFTAPRRAFAEAIRAWRRGDRSGARRLLNEALEDIHRWSSPVPSTVMRLALVELLLEEGAHDEAQRELEAVLPFWRKARATWYLSRLAEWARERGLTLTA